MAKKKGSRSRSFNMSAAVRDVLTANPNLSGKEVEAELKKLYPKQKINPNSLNVAFSNARKKLGITKNRKTTARRRRPSAEAFDMASLQAARKFVAEVGDVDSALEAVRQLKSLQINS